MPPVESFDGAMQMALDEILLGSVSRPMMRFYRWSSPCVTFGYFQKLSEVRSLHPDLPAVRRWTGGGIVQHGSDLTFSLMIPKEEYAASLPPALFYQNLHALLAEVIQRFSRSKIRIAGEDQVLLGASCFTAPARNDLLLEGRKILGGAQRRSAGSLLYQGSLQGTEILLSPDTLAIPSQVPKHLALALSTSVTQITLGEVQRSDALALLSTRYGSQSWNARR